MSAERDRPEGFDTNQISRRNFRKISGAGLAGAALLGWLAVAAASKGRRRRWWWWGQH